METEVPAMLQAHSSLRPGNRFTFHSSRMRMKKVQKEELAAMDAESDRCALELSDARVDVLGYACLVAIMAMGRGYHRVSQQRLTARTAENGASAPVITSAGALVDALHAMGAKKIALLAPYMVPLTELVMDYIAAEGFEIDLVRRQDRLLGLFHRVHGPHQQVAPMRGQAGHFSQVGVPDHARESGVVRVADDRVAEFKFFVYLKKI